MQEDLPKAKVKRINIPRRQTPRDRKGGERFVKYYHFCIYEYLLCHRHNVRAESAEVCKYFLPLNPVRRELLSVMCHVLRHGSMECRG